MKGIAQVVVSRIIMAAPGMSECRAGEWGAGVGTPPGPTTSPSPALSKILAMPEAWQKGWEHEEHAAWGLDG